MLESLSSASIVFAAIITALGVFFTLLTPRAELAGVIRRATWSEAFSFGGILLFFYATMVVAPVLLGGGMAAEKAPTLDCGIVWDGRNNGRDCP